MAQGWPTVGLPGSHGEHCLHHAVGVAAVVEEARNVALHVMTVQTQHEFEKEA